jgi:hypothetical protein
MIDLSKLQQEIKLLLADEGLATALDRLLQKIPSFSSKYNDLISLESRLNDVNRQKVKGIISQSELQLIYNQLRDLLLEFVDGLKEKDFEQPVAAPAPTDPRQGSILYQIPETMQVQKETRCRVRIAYDKEVIVKNLDLTLETTIQSIRISEIMNVEIVDPSEEPAFAIRTFSSSEQFIDTDDFTEWLFFVKPLKEGEYPLMLRVSVIEEKGGKERRRDIVLEEQVQIIAETVKEEETSFKKSEHLLSMGSDPAAPELVNPEPVDLPGSTRGILEGPQVEIFGPGSEKPKARKGINRQLMAGLSTVAVILVAVTFLFILPQDNAVGPKEDDQWRSASERHTIESYQNYRNENPEGKFVEEAEKRILELTRDSIRPIRRGE